MLISAINKVNGQKEDGSFSGGRTIKANYILKAGVLRWGCQFPLPNLQLQHHLGCFLFHYDVQAQSAAMSLTVRHQSLTTM